MAGDKKPFLLRLDPALHEALQRWAADELRSLDWASSETFAQSRLLWQRLLITGFDNRSMRRRVRLLLDVHCQHLGDHARILGPR